MPRTGYKVFNLRIEDSELLDRIENRILFNKPPSLRIVKCDLLAEAVKLLAKKYEVQ